MIPAATAACNRFFAHLRTITLLAAALCSLNLAAKAQSADTQSSDTNKSWTSSTDSQPESSDPTHTTESHTQSGNRTIDKQSVQRRDANGDYAPYRDIEKETVQVDANTFRTSTRTFGRDANGDKVLLQQVDEEEHTSPSGDSNTVRTMSNSDGNGALQVIRREIEDTKKLDKNTDQTNTTVLLPNANGGLAAAMKTEERREKDANGSINSQNTTLVPNADGKWQIEEVKKTTITQDGNNLTGTNLTKDERISRPNIDGNLTEVSRTVTRDVASAQGEKTNTVETYSVDVPGTVRDSNTLHLVQRSVTAQRTDPGGEQSTIKQVEQSNPADPGAMQVTVVSTDTVHPGASGAQATRTIQMRNANGTYGDIGVVSVDTTKSDNLHSVQVQIAPTDKPK